MQISNSMKEQNVSESKKDEDGLEKQGLFAMKYWSKVCYIRGLSERYPHKLLSPFRSRLAVVKR